MSHQSAWEYYTREARRVLDESAAGSDLDEERGDAGRHRGGQSSSAASPDFELLSASDAGGA